MLRRLNNCSVSVATSVTGVGELIMRAALAREAARGIAAGDADVDAACSAVIEDTILQVRQFAKCICELHLQQSPFYIGVFGSVHRPRAVRSTCIVHGSSFGEVAAQQLNTPTTGNELVQRLP